MTSEPAGGNGKPRPPVRPCCGASGQKHAYFFRFQPDITAAELAASMELLFFGIATTFNRAFAPSCDLLYKGMDEGTRRHWMVQELSLLAVPQKPGLHLPPGAKG